MVFSIDIVLPAIQSLLIAVLAFELIRKTKAIDRLGRAAALKEHMVWTEWIGYVAAFLTTASFVPQAWLTFKTRDVRGISLGMYSAFTLGVALWLVYGVLIQAWPVVIANTITLALAASILWMRVQFARTPST